LREMKPMRLPIPHLRRGAGVAFREATADLWLRSHAGGCRFGTPSLLTHHVEDRLLPLEQTVRHPLDPPTTALIRTCPTC
jgi:hypothetical protein